MHAHLTRWQRLQVNAMGPALVAGLVFALLTTGAFAGMSVQDRRSRARSPKGAR